MQRGDGSDDEKIVRSPFAELMKKITFPDLPLTTFVFQALKMNEKTYGDRNALIDAVRDQAIRFKDIEPLSKRFASALTRIGFKKGDVLYYVTYNAALLYVLHFGAWLCGGAVRGCYQNEDKEEIERQMKETGCRFVLCESETAPNVKWALERLGWPVTLMSIDGEVEGVMPVEDMVYKDDGSAYKDEIKINPKEDIVFIPSTNGSTGLPKGALHTHYNIVGFLAGIGAPFNLDRVAAPALTVFSIAGNFNIGPFLSFYMSLMNGNTFISMSKFDKTSFFAYLNKYKPEQIFLFPYLANWFARCVEIDSQDLTFLKNILLGGSVFDHVTLSMMKKRLPFIQVNTIYGMTETLVISSISTGQHSASGTSGNISIEIKVEKFEDEHHVSCGLLLPFVEAKVVDTETGCTLGRKAKGKLLVRTPFVMKGYLKYGNGKGYTSIVDSDGWLDTGDVGFFDDDGHLYIVDRLKSIFKYHMYQVSPSEIESVIGDHPAVLSVGVVGVPDPLTTAAARAYVIIKPGCSITEDEIKKHVADNTPIQKHLHGGVVFVDKLPQSRGGKLDRTTLLQRAINEIKSNSPSSH